MKSEPRFLWVRGIDQRRFVASMLSVPLSWNDQVVGVLNVQTEETRDFTPGDVAQLFERGASAPLVHLNSDLDLCHFCHARLRRGEPQLYASDESR